MKNLDYLFRPIKIGNLALKNRIVMPPMVTGFSGIDGEVTDRLIHYHEARAKGGVGMIILESASVDPVGVGPSAHLHIFQDKSVAGLNRLAEAVKAHGTKIGLQLGHTGRQAKWVGEGVSPVAPSPIMCRFVGSSLNAKMPKELSVAGIQDLVEKFSEGALRGKRAGFDLVEVHAAHGYLLNEFMSPYTNKRADEYGGDIAGRMKFPLEILRAIRNKVGPDFPVSFRINADDYIDGGLKLQETRIMAKMLEDEGVSLIHVTASIYESIFYNSPKMWQVQPMCVPRGCFVHLGEGIKKAVTVPVIVAGRINDPRLANEIIEDGKADLISMGRALIADPELPNKAAEGRFEDIRRCIACNKCVSRLFDSLSIKCTVNAEVGKEREYRIEKAPLPRNVMVVGGGPAGMEFARVAASRGHHISLYEKGNELGGQLFLAAAPPFKQEIKDFTAYLTGQLKKTGIQIFLRTELTSEMTESLKPDFLILATGSNSMKPAIPGVDLGHVQSARQILKEGLGALKGKENVIVVGSGQVGCETAEFIWEESKGQKKIQIVEMLPELASDMDYLEREFLIQRLKEKGIQANLSTKVIEITEEGVLTSDQTGKRLLIRGDAIVLAMGAEPELELAKKLEEKKVKFYTLGDCQSARGIFDAIQEANHLAREI